MARVHGVELQTGPIGGDGDRAHRIIRYKNRTYLHKGTPLSFSPGVPAELHQHQSAGLARTYMADYVSRYRNLYGYRLAFETTTRLHRCDAASPEAAFLRAWATETHHQIGADLPDPRRYWVVVRDIHTAAAIDHTSATVLEYLLAGPHFDDPHRDQVIGLVGKIPSQTSRGRWPVTPTSLDYTTHRTTLSILGDRAWACPHTLAAPSLLTKALHPRRSRRPVLCTSCETRVAELLGHLLQGKDLRNLTASERTHLIATAHRIVRLPTTHEPGLTPVLLTPGVS